MSQNNVTIKEDILSIRRRILSNPIPAHDRGLNELHNFLDFKLEKTHQAITEIRKMISSALLTYLLLICITALLAFGKGVEDTISAPLLDVKLNKNYAAEITLLLSCGALFWFYIAMTNATRLERNFNELLIHRYAAIIKSPRYFSHFTDEKGAFSAGHLIPLSLYAAFDNAINTFPSIFRSLARILFTTLLATISYGGSLYLAWKIGNVLLLIITFVCLIPVAIAQYTCNIYVPQKLEKEFLKRYEDAA